MPHARSDLRIRCRRRAQLHPIWFTKHLLCNGNHLCRLPSAIKLALLLLRQRQCRPHDEPGGSICLFRKSELGVASRRTIISWLPTGRLVRTSKVPLKRLPVRIGSCTATHHHDYLCALSKSVYPILPRPYYTTHLKKVRLSPVVITSCGCEDPALIEHY